MHIKAGLSLIIHKCLIFFLQPRRNWNSNYPEQTIKFAKNNYLIGQLTWPRLYIGVILSPTGHRTGLCRTHTRAKYGFQPCLCTLSSPPDMNRAIPRSGRPVTSASAARTNCIRGQREDSQAFTAQPATT